jgi:hypothetical protein
MDDNPRLKAVQYLMAQGSGNYNPMARPESAPEVRSYHGPEIPMEEFDRRDQANRIKNMTSEMSRKEFQRYIDWLDASTQEAASPEHREALREGMPVVDSDWETIYGPEGTFGKPEGMQVRDRAIRGDPQARRREMNRPLPYEDLQSSGVLDSHTQQLLDALKNAR